MSGEAGGPWDLSLNVRPGVISVLLFLVFDLVLHTVIDGVLARASCWVYYKRIFKGHPLHLKSADLPGVTSFLLGAPCAPFNLLIVVLKLAFLVALLNLNISIDGGIERAERAVTLTARLALNLSNSERGPNSQHGSGYLWHFARTCYEKPDTGDRITFYTLAFNLTPGADGASLHDGTRDPIVRGSIQCLSPGRVQRESVRALQVITGCSPVRSAACADPNPTTVPRKRLMPKSIKEVDIHLSSGFTLRTRASTFTNLTLFPGYPGAKLVCLSVHAGGAQRGDFRRTCVLTVQLPDHGFLIENWTSDRAGFHRVYAGPVFDNDPRMSFEETAIAAYRLFGPGVPYGTLASLLVANSGQVRFETQRVVVLGPPRAGTVVKFPALVLAGVVAAIVVAARVAVGCCLRADDRPRLNEIDGLSSIAREENSPSGKSLSSGRGIAIGLILRFPNVARLVPVQRGYHVVTRASVDEIY